MATDLGKPSTEPQERAPRPRGAHAAVKGRPGASLASKVRLAASLASKGRAAAAPASPAPRAFASPARGPGPAPARRVLPRPTAAGLCAAALVAVVVPLAVLQIPDAIAWSLPSQFAAAGPNALASLLRATSLALPAMAVAAPFGALATRRFRAGPVLLAGLLIIGVADALGESARTVPVIGADRVLHGLGAGISMAAVVAVVADRRPTTRSLAGWWACAVVFALAAAPALMRHRVTVGGWRAALQPYPWLAGAALALAALYAVLAEGTARTAVRSAFPAAERALLALLAAPVAGMCAVTVAVTYRGDRAVVAAAIADATALVGLAVTAVRASTAGRLAAVCAVIGFTVAPAAGAVSALTQPGWEAGGAALAAALCAAALALTRPAASARTATAGGLFVAAGAFAAASLAGSAVADSRVLALLCVPLAGGLTAALAVAVRGAGTGGAVGGIVLLLAGAVGGYLAAGAMQLQALQAARTTAAVHAALVTTTDRWALLAAVVTAAVALVMAAAPSWRGPARPAARPIVGKLEHSGESSAFGGGLAHHREDRRPGTQ